MIASLLATALLCSAWAVQYFVPKKRPFKIPAGWPQPVYDFQKNPLTEEGIALGRTLFYDEILSKDSSLSCGSCHQQFGAFNTFDHPLSHGVEGQVSFRNAPALYNLAWMPSFMWDGGINHLDLQFLAPVTSHQEMGADLNEVLEKLRKNESYRKAFKAAFGDPTINTQRLGKALSQFMLTLVSDNSRYDKVKRGEAQFSLPEQLGEAIFLQKCAVCHQPPLFTDFSFRNTGMTKDLFLQDSGRMRITGLSADSLSFKVPSLRNVTVSYPYGHDGRFFSLMNVFEHYRKNLRSVPQTDPLLKQPLALSNYEIGQLRAFLNTLTDTSFLTNPAFAPPGQAFRHTAPADNHQ
ncbi:MAG: cytochrome-c peroxidase [Sphingobacteriia bacterium]|nr:MAG: cytochrome-c peroxidase [Sphingobacteriia bacterium]